MTIEAGDDPQGCASSLADLGRIREDLGGAVALMAAVRAAGAAGATIGRNIWGFDRIADSVRAFKAVLHDGLAADEALKRAGL